MDTKRIESFKQFAKYLEYPMVVFEAESGHVLDINYEAEILLGGKVQTITMEPGRALTKFNFWEMLHGKKSLIWHRIRLTADGKEMLVSGLINEMTEEGTLIYTILFERRADLNIGSLTLEQIVDHAGIVAIHVGKTEEGFQIEYVSQNVNRYGYTRGQLYDKNMKMSDMVCAEDWERNYARFVSAVEQKVGEETMECRILTEEQEIIPVRLLIHYIYDDFGELTDLEILLLDLQEELHRNKENDYLNNAISKMKSVVVVKLFRAGKRQLCYVSRNAGMVGMNVEALRKGYKLTEDYIHPEDRDNVIDAVYQAIANGITDYVQVYRMVTDAGKKIWVENEVTINRMSDGEAEISFLLTDITEQKKMEQELAASAEQEMTVSEEMVESSADTITIDHNDKEMLYEFQLMADTLSKDAQYYSVVLNAKGELLTKPAGPANDIGQFYDLFERPQFKEEFVQASDKAKEMKIPQSTTFSVEWMKVHMIFAPLILEDNVAAYWVLTSFADNGMQILHSAAKQQWELANTIAKCFYAQEIVQKENRIRRLTEMQLHKEQTERRILEDMMIAMSQDGNQALREMCHKAGNYLSVENIGIYLKNKETQNIETYYIWNQTGETLETFGILQMSASEYDVMMSHFNDKQQIVIDRKEQNPYLRSLIRQTNMAIIIQRIQIDADTKGYIAFTDADTTREFDEIDMQFVESVTKLLAGLIKGRQFTRKPDVMKNGFMDAYDHIRDAVYVKDNKSGEIIFANKATDKLFGYSLVGMMASEIVNDQLDQYRNIEGVRKRFIAEKKVTKWQTYMKELDQIMNIVEVHMETIYGADYSLFILKKNKNKNK